MLTSQPIVREEQHNVITTIHAYTMTANGRSYINFLLVATLAYTTTTGMSANTVTVAIDSFFGFIVGPGDEDHLRNGDKRGICLNITREGIMQTVCGHMFHKDCLRPACTRAVFWPPKW